MSEVILQELACQASALLVVILAVVEVWRDRCIDIFEGIVQPV